MLKKENKKEKVNEMLIKTNMEDWLYVIGSKKEIFKRNLIAGISRGVGITIGATIITAVIVYILQKLVKLNLPLISDYIVDIIDMVERKR